MMPYFWVISGPENQIFSAPQMWTVSKIRFQTRIFSDNPFDLRRTWYEEVVEFASRVQLHKYASNFTPTTSEP